MAVPVINPALQIGAGDGNLARQIGADVSNLLTQTIDGAPDFPHIARLAIEDAQYSQQQQAHKAQKAVQDVGIFHCDAPLRRRRRVVGQQLRRQGQGFVPAGDGAGGFGFAQAFQQAAYRGAGG